MQEIRPVLRRKQAQYAQLAKEIELLQQAEEKMREIAPLLADSEDDDSTVLAEVDDETHGDAAKAVTASANSTDNSNSAPRPAALRWP